MRAPSQLRLRACHAARKFVRSRAVRSRRRPWLPIALRWRRGNAVAMAGRDALRGRVHLGGMHVHMHLRFAYQTTLTRSVRASQPASRVPSASTRSVVREFQSTSATSSSSHTTRVHTNRDEMHRVLREDHALRIGRASRSVAPPRPRSRAPQPTAGTRVIAALRAQSVPMLHAVSRSIDMIESRHEDRRTHAIAPRITASRATLRLPQAVRRATQPPLSPPQSMARVLDLVWRAPVPTLPAATATPTMSPRTPPSTINATTAAAGLARIEATADAAHVHAAVRAQVLDPALVERLADDVIRRIERHARIERERRGL